MYKFFFYTIVYFSTFYSRSVDIILTDVLILDKCFLLPTGRVNFEWIHNHIFIHQIILISWKLIRFSFVHFRSHLKYSSPERINTERFLSKLLSFIVFDHGDINLPFEKKTYIIYSLSLLCFTMVIPRQYKLYNSYTCIVLAIYLLTKFLYCTKQRSMFKPVNVFLT